MPISPNQEREIEQLRATTYHTHRVTSQAMEDILYKPFPVLNAGFVRVIDYMGNDAAVAQAARVSYGKGTRSTSDDTALINYLLRHQHCYHPAMEVLTVSGWKRWQDCDHEETFLVPNPGTRTYRQERLPVL
jgi:hypothetical protein